MSAEERYFPVDIFAVKRYGIAQWQREFFWPVADHEFVSLYDEIEQLWRKLIVTSSPEISLVLLHARLLPNEVCHFLHAVQVIGRVYDKGLKPVCSPGARWYAQLLNHHDGKDTGTAAQATTKKERVAHKLLQGLKKQVRNIQYNSWRALLKLPRGGGLIHVFGIPSEVVISYLRKIPRRVVIMYPSDWSDNGQPVEIAPLLYEKLRAVARSLSEATRAIAEEYSIVLPTENQNELLIIIEKEIMESARLLEQVRGKINSYAITHFVASSIRGHLPRAIALLLKERGVRITSFTHGGHIGLFRSPTMSMAEFAIADEFVMYTKGCYPLFKKIFEHKPPPFDNKVKLLSSDSNYFINLHRAYKKSPLPNQVRKIMLIGCPQNQLRKPQASASLGLMQLDFELRLIQVLREAGFLILYKAHPDRLREVEGIFEEISTVIRNPFEKVTHLADAFIFGNIRTSTFPAAICTNKPIVAYMLKDEFPPPFPEAMELLQKRCRFVSTEFDVRNRLMFDPKDLHRAITENNLAPNTEFAEQYLFPSRI